MIERAANTEVTAREWPQSPRKSVCKPWFPDARSKLRVAHQQDAARAGSQKPRCVQQETVLRLFVRSVNLFCTHPSSTEMKLNRKES